MEDITTIRIGRCPCIEVDGNITDRLVNVESLYDKILVPPMVLRLQQIELPEGFEERRKAVAETQCHIFLEGKVFDTRPGKYLAELELIAVTSGQAGKPQVYFGAGTGGYWIHDWHKWLPIGQPLTLNEVDEGVRHLFRQLRLRRFNNWLSYMEVQPAAVIS